MSASLEPVTQLRRSPDCSVEVSVVVPVYRSAAMLRELHRRLSCALQGVRDSFEIILVEDCGPDEAWRVIEELAAGDDRVRGVRLTRNFGQHAATICGIARTSGRWVITLDDDLEQRPEDIPALLSKARQGYDLVYGVYGQRTHSVWRNITSTVARKLFRIAIPSLNYEYTSFRIINGTIARNLVQFDSPFPFVDGYLSWLTNSYACVEVAHEQRADGASNYNFSKLLTHTINIFVTFSDLPLRFASWIGIGAFVVGMLWLAGIVLGRLLGGITVSGFASVMAGIILFGGVQLLILGIIGQYLSRMNFKSSRKPLFLVSEEVGFGQDEHVRD
jgi:undecaprenyl-phosphate 4-deoxy-4-formamido-L-arabinose transferase